MTTDDWVDADLALEDASLNLTVSQRLTIKRFAYLFDFIEESWWDVTFLQSNLNEGPISSLSLCAFP